MSRLRRRRTADETYTAGHEQDGENTPAQLLDERLERVEAELTTAAGGTSLCALSKAAGSVPAVKYLEGRLAVLLKVRRSAHDPDETRSAVETLAVEWRDELARVTDKDFGPDWLAYRAGGVDELDELTDIMP